MSFTRAGEMTARSNTGEKQAVKRLKKKEKEEWKILVLEYFIRMGKEKLRQLIKDNNVELM